MASSTKKNAIEKRLETLSNHWLDFTAQEEPRLLRWLIDQEEKRMVEAWLVGAMLIRDVVITGLRVYGIRAGRPVVTSRLAKWKTMLQLVLIFGILVFINVRVIEAKLTSQPLVLIDSWSHLVLNGLVAAVTLLAVVSGVRYLRVLHRSGT